MSVLPPLPAHRAVLLVSCRVKNLKGSRINKRKAKLQQAFGRHEGACTQRAHCERGSTPYSCGVLAPDTHITFTQRRHTEKVGPRLVCIVAAASFRADVERGPFVH